MGVVQPRSSATIIGEIVQKSWKSNCKLFSLLIDAKISLLYSLLVTMQAQKEAPPDLQCRDKFLVQSVIASDGATTKDVTTELVGWYDCFELIMNLWASLKLMNLLNF